MYTGGLQERFVFLIKAIDITLSRNVGGTNLLDAVVN